jgi:hypothetical protein
MGNAFEKGRLKANFYHQIAVDQFNLFYELGITNRR